MYLRKLVIREELIPHFKQALYLFGKEKNVGWTLTSNDVGSYHYFIDTTSLIEKDIINRAEALLAEEKATEYARLRKAEYDKLNQFELMYNDKINGTNTWTTEIYKIKDKFPKKK